MAQVRTSFQSLGKHPAQHRRAWKTGQSCTAENDDNCNDALCSSAPLCALRPTLVSSPLLSSPPLRSPPLPSPRPSTTALMSAASTSREKHHLITVLRLSGTRRRRGLAASATSPRAILPIQSHRSGTGRITQPWSWLLDLPPPHLGTPPGSTGTAPPPAYEYTTTTTTTFGD